MSSFKELKFFKEEPKSRMLRAAIRNNKSSIRQNVAKTADRDFSLTCIAAEQFGDKTTKKCIFAEIVVFVGFGLPKGSSEKNRRICTDAFNHLQF